MEGVWGAGKTTNARHLAQHLTDDGFTAVSLSASPEQTEYYDRFGFEAVRNDAHAVTMVAHL